jgi:hypothetical protein
MTSGHAQPDAAQEIGGTPYAVVGRPSDVAVGRAWNALVVGGSSLDRLR